MPPPAWLVRAGYYGLALLLVAMATTVRWALGEALNPAPFLVFYLAWVAAAFGGLGPGLLATLASWLCVNLFFDSTPWHIGFSDPGSVSRFVVLLIGGLAVSVVGEKMRRARVRERRQTEELTVANAALRASEEKYRFLVENSTDVTGTIDLRGKLTFASANVEKMTGYRPDELIGKTLWDFLVPECHDLVKESLRRRLRGEDVPPYELLAVGKDGRRIPFEVVTASIVDEGGNIVGMQGVCRDITDRKRVEEALRESEFHLAQAQQIAHLGSWSWNFAEDRLFWSDETYRLYGLQPGELVPRHEDFLRFVHPEDRPRVEQCVRETLAHGGSCQLDFRLLQRGGQERYVHCEAQVVLDREGHPVRAEGALQDITERKKAEEAVAESRKRYRGLVEKINDWVWEIDANGVYTYVSPRAPELLGYAPEEIVGKTPFDFMPPTEAQRVWNAFEPIWRERKPLELLENTLVRKDGCLVTVETSGMPVFGEEGSFLGYSGIDRDVTARKEAEEALRESEERFRKVFEEGPIGMVLTSRDFGFFRANPAFCRMLGYTPDEMNSLTFFDVTHPEHRAADRDNMERLWQGEIPIYRTQKRYIAKNGDIRWGNLSASLIQDHEGRPLYALAIVEDITEHKRTEEALRELNATLESRVAQRTAQLQDRARQLQKLTLDLTEAEERERARIAEILHDDLQQVLAAAKFQVSLLGSRIKNDADVQEIAGQVKDLLTDAIAKSRSLSHELSSPALAQSDLGTALEWLAEHMQTKHGFTVHLEAGERIEIASEPLRVLLYKAAQELLFNAIKHAGVQEARLRLRRRRGRLRLSVSDQGRGFDPTDSSYKLGFGLLSLRERIGLLGGRLKIRSAVGKGSTFLITVPEADQDGIGGVLPQPDPHPLRVRHE